MAAVSTIMSHKVNGVAALHSELVKSQILPDFVKFYGEDKFTNVTNGVTQRRWLNQCNPRLSELIANALGGYEFLKDFNKIIGIEKFADVSKRNEPGFQQFRKEWAEIKYGNKVRLAKYIKQTTGASVSPDALFDIQCKRLHEYKRQQLNIFGVIHRYLKIKTMSAEEKKNLLPRCSIFAAKAAPGYYNAKAIILLINSVARIVNNDPDVGDLLKVVYIPDYRVTAAEVIIPGSDISEHISTAGFEGSGTSNMKFAINGGLLIGTLDGANIEIATEVGEDNIFMFGLLSEQTDEARHNHRFPSKEHPFVFPEGLRKVFDAIRGGMFGDGSKYAGILDGIEHHGDYYLVSDDFDSYCSTQDLIDEAYKDKDAWLDKCILSVARMGLFSSDRCIQEYADQVWNVEPLKMEAVNGTA